MTRSDGGMSPFDALCQSSFELKLGALQLPPLLALPVLPSLALPPVLAKPEPVPLMS